MAPSSESNRNSAGLPLLSLKAPEAARVLKTWPVGAEVPAPEAGGTVTVSPTFDTMFELETE